MTPGPWPACHCSPYGSFRSALIVTVVMEGFLTIVIFKS
jgi:hypothetical protein